MKTIQTIKDIYIKPGKRVNYKLPLAKLPDGTNIFMPIIIAQGEQDGPTLLLTSLIHGIEIGGYDTIIKVFNRLNIRKMRGRIVGIPIVNPLAFNVANRFTPQDSVDLNRIFPGDIAGTISQRIAYILSHHVAKHVDFVIDFHSCNPPSEFFTIVTDEGNQNVRDISWKMAEAFGAFTVSPSFETPGTFSNYLVKIDKPSITPELVFSRRFDASSQIGVTGTFNVMKYLNMIDGDYERLPNTRPFNKEYSYTVCNANTGGFIYFRKNIGSQIKKGDVLADIKDAWGEQVTQVKSPVTGLIIAYPMAGNQAVMTGDKIAYIAYKK